jgi:hypothetical protein
VAGEVTSWGNVVTCDDVHGAIFVIVDDDCSVVLSVTMEMLAFPDI